MSCVKSLLAAGAVLFAAAGFSAQVTVIKQAGYANPAIRFNGVSGDQAMSGYVLSDLKACGWFDVVSTGDVKYEISGSASGNTVSLSVTGLDNFKVQSPYSAATAKTAANKLVDAILKKIFDIPGICNSKIAFVAKNGKISEICMCDIDGGSLKQLTKLNTLSLEPEWGMKNSMLVFTYFHYNYADVVGLNVSTGKMNYLSNFQGLNNAGVISPNGRFLAVILSKDKKVNLYVKSLSDGSVKRITSSDTVEGTPCWSPDSNSVCFASNMKYGRPKLYIYNFSSNKITAINCLGSEAVSPSWSPKGDKIVYSAKFGPNYTLALYDVKSGESSTVDVGGGDWFGPSFAPDGRHVAVARRVNFKFDLFVVDTWTGDMRKVMSSGLNIASPSWSGLL